MFAKSTQFKYFYSEESWTSISCNTEAETLESVRQSFPTAIRLKDHKSDWSFKSLSTVRRNLHNSSSKQLLKLTQRFKDYFKYRPPTGQHNYK